MVFNLTVDHQPLFRLLGQLYMWFYDVGYSKKQRGRCGMSVEPFIYKSNQQAHPFNCLRNPWSRPYLKPLP